MFEVGVVVTFESAHRLRGDFGPATRLHGHTYRLEVAVRGERLSEDGTLVDIALLQGAVDEVVTSLHLRDLDEVPGLAGRNTTAERVAEHVTAEVGRRLSGIPRCTGLGVRVWESPHAYAAHHVELGGDGR